MFVHTELSRSSYYGGDSSKKNLTRSGIRSDIYVDSKYLKGFEHEA